LIVLIVRIDSPGRIRGGGRAGKAWVALGAVIGGGAAMLLWFIAEKPPHLDVESTWRFTASPTGLRIEWQDAKGGAYSQKTYPRDRIRDVTVQRKRRAAMGAIITRFASTPIFRTPCRCDISTSVVATPR
jgi:hypothetical protein